MKHQQIYLVIFTLVVGAPAFAKPLTADDINGATLGASQVTRAVLVKAQILLDRAGFSPGVIDGRNGDNFRKALRFFQKKSGIQSNGRLDTATWAKLAAISSDQFVTEYIITGQDVKGPFVTDVPTDLEQRAQLKSLDYSGPIELLAERFHMDDEFLRELNAGKDFSSPGVIVLVANVQREDKADQATRLEVDKSNEVLLVYNKADELIASYPASVGSEEKPAPSGTLKVTRVARGPTYTYDPEFKFKGVKATAKVTIAPGPNNPVGSVWIGLSEKSYGIHGTPEPSKVGKVESHGCVRLTNWDALDLAARVKSGTEVKFLD